MVTGTVITIIGVTDSGMGGGWVFWLGCFAGLADPLISPVFPRIQSSLAVPIGPGRWHGGRRRIWNGPFYRGAPCGVGWGHDAFPLRRADLQRGGDCFDDHRHADHRRETTVTSWRAEIDGKRFPG